MGRSNQPKVTASLLCIRSRWSQFGSRINRRLPSFRKRPERSLAPSAGCLSWPCAGGFWGSSSLLPERLTAIRSIFDDGGIGMLLIGMPGIEKRVARFPQFYSRIGFVHEFRPLDEAQMTRLLNERWLPAGVRLPDAVLAPDVIATLIRMSGGNFRLLTRLLTQVERILKVNQSEIVSKEIVTAARDSLVIGQV